MRYGAGDEDESEAFLGREGHGEPGKSAWDPNIYRLAHHPGTDAHRVSLQLPKHELHETGSQLRRAAKSVSANPVEGYGRRRYKAEYRRFLVFAKASLDETEEHLRYVHGCHPEQQAAATTLLKAANLSGWKFSRFMQLVEANHRA